MKAHVAGVVWKSTCPVWVFVTYQLVLFSVLSKSIDLSELDLLAKLPGDELPRGGREGRVGRGGASVDLSDAADSAEAVKRNPASLGWLMAAAMRLCDERPGDCVGGPMRMGSEMDLASLMELKKRRIEGASALGLSLPQSFNDDLAIRRQNQLNALIG